MPIKIDDYRILNNLLLELKDWQYDDKTLETIRAEIRNLPNYKEVIRQFDTFEQWVKDNNYPISSKELSDLRNAVISGYVFNVVNKQMNLLRIDRPENPAPNPQELDGNNLLLRLALSFHSEDLKNDIIEKIKADPLGKRAWNVNENFIVAQGILDNIPKKYEDLEARYLRVYNDRDFKKMVIEDKNQIIKEYSDKLRNEINDLTLDQRQKDELNNFVDQAIENQATLACKIAANDHIVDILLKIDRYDTGTKKTLGKEIFNLKEKIAKNPSYTFTEPFKQELESIHSQYAHNYKELSEDVNEIYRAFNIPQLVHDYHATSQPQKQNQIFEEIIKDASSPTSYKLMKKAIDDYSANELKFDGLEDPLKERLTNLYKESYCALRDKANQEFERLLNKYEKAYQANLIRPAIVRGTKEKANMPNRDEMKNILLGKSTATLKTHFYPVKIFDLIEQMESVAKTIMVLGNPRSNNEPIMGNYKNESSSISESLVNNSEDESFSESSLVDSDDEDDNANVNDNTNDGSHYDVSYEEDEYMSQNKNQKNNGDKKTRKEELEIDDLDFYRNKIIAAHKLLTDPHRDRKNRETTHLDIIKKDHSVVKNFFTNTFRAIGTALRLGPGLVVAKMKGTYHDHDAEPVRFWHQPKSHELNTSVKQIEKNLNITRPKKT